jgi:KDO2-lipid IV(A) lauroyltransferase
LKALAYYIALPCIYLLSHMPWFMLYGLSNLLSFVLYYVIRYRRQVVRENLRKSFPEKSPAEIITIEKEFYRFFADVMVENLKSLTMSGAELEKMCRIKNPEVLEQIIAQGKSVMIVMGHYGNWEICGRMVAHYFSFPVYFLYKPLSNPYFDKLTKYSRERYKTNMLSAQESVKKLIELKDTPLCVCFIADQTPHPDKAFWVPFLNRETPVFTGPEKVTSKLDYTVFYLSITYNKRKDYSLEFVKITDTPKALANEELTSIHTHLLEKDIKASPAYWLWSHKRWKHTRKK